MQRDDERERGFERALRQSLTAAAAAPSGQCVDAETLAAWADGTLSPMASSAIEAHASSCPECQALVAMFARTVPTAPVAVPLWRRWHMNWLVPIATAAIAVAIWVAAPGREPTPSAREEQQLAVQPSQPPGTPSETSRVDPPRAAAEPSPARDLRSAADALRKELEVRQKAERGARVATPAAATAPSLARSDEAVARSRAAAEQNLAVGVPPVPTPSPAPAAPAPAPQATATPAPVAERVETPAAPVPPAPAAASPALAATPAPGTAPAAIGAAKALPPDSLAAMDAKLEKSKSAADAEQRALFVPAAIEVLSPTAMSRWRIAIGKSVEFVSVNGIRSADIPTDAIILGGSSPADVVCWMVGRAGAVYLTVDGTRFTRIPFPDSIDLVAVRATDARTATVTAASGRMFRTSDGGKTWQ